MMKTSGSRRISSAMASRNASRTVICTISVPSGIAGSWGMGCVAAFGATAAGGVASAFREAGSSAGGWACAGGALTGVLARSSLLSPSASNNAIGVLTFTPCVPSSTRILPRVPSSTASTSMVALSVSISAITSPGATLSPSFLSHLVRLPSSMVGERAGIKIWVGICATSPFSEQNVGIKLGYIRLRIGLGEVGRIGNDIAHILVHRLQLLLRRPLLLKKALARLLDRIMLGAHLLHFILGAVLGRIGHGVTAIAVGLHLQDDRAFARTTPVDRHFASSRNRAHVHAINLDAGDLERDAAMREIGFGRRTRDRSAHGIAVVLNDEDNRQLPQRGHVEAFVDLALVGSAIAEIGQRDIVVAAITVGEGQPGAKRHLSTDDAVPTIKILLLGEHVHRAALTLGVSSTASGQLSHHAARAHAGCKHMAMIAVAGDDLIAFLQVHLHADDDGFLADVKVAEAADEAHAVKLAGLFLEAANEEHFAER